MIYSGVQIAVVIDPYVGPGILVAGCGIKGPGPSSYLIFHVDPTKVTHLKSILPHILTKITSMYD